MNVTNLSVHHGGGCAPWMALTLWCAQGRSELGLQMPVAPANSSMKVEATSTHMLTASSPLNLAIAPRDSFSWIPTQVAQVVRSINCGSAEHKKSSSSPWSALMIECDGPRMAVSLYRRYANPSQPFREFSRMMKRQRPIDLPRL